MNKFKMLIATTLILFVVFSAFASKSLILAGLVAIAAVIMYEIVMSLCGQSRSSDISMFDLSRRQNVSNH